MQSTAAKINAFWREESPWPFVHAVVPLAVFVSTRDFLLTLVLIYVWESVETLLSLLLPFFAESKADSLIGDPIIGVLSVLNFLIYDTILGLSEPFLTAVSPARRIVSLIIVAVLSLVVMLDASKALASDNWNLRVGALAYAALYFITVIAFYVGVASEPAVASSLYIWLAMLIVYALAVTPIAPVRTRRYFSAWLRVLYAELLFLVVGGIAALTASAGR